jgi:hypothetical protein
MDILGIILGFLLTVGMTLLALFIIRQIKPAREIAFGKTLATHAAK